MEMKNKNATVYSREATTNCWCERNEDREHDRDRMYKMQCCDKEMNGTGALTIHVQQQQKLL